MWITQPESGESVDYLTPSSVKTYCSYVHKILQIIKLGFTVKGQLWNF